MYLRGFYRSPEEGGGEGEQIVEPRTYTEAEVDELKKKIRSAGFNDGVAKQKREGMTPLLDKVRKTPGFEEVADLDEPTLTEILNLASARKRNSKHDEEMQGKLQKETGRADRAEQRYRDSVINARLVGLVSADEKGNPRATNPTQVVKLLRADFKFDLVEGDNGGEVIRVLGPDGTPLRKDAFEYASVDDIVNDFMSKNPHFQPASAKVSTGAQNKTGAPGAGVDLQATANKPAHTWTPEEKKMVGAALREGRLEYNPRHGLTTTK